MSPKFWNCVDVLVANIVILKRAQPFITNTSRQQKVENYAHIDFLWLKTKGYSNPRIIPNFAIEWKWRAEWERGGEGKEGEKVVVVANTTSTTWRSVMETRSMKSC